MGSLLNEIRAILDGVAAEHRKAGGLSDRMWTAIVKDKLYALGHDHGYAVSASGCKGKDTGEWLFDLMWAKGTGEPWQFTAMPLAVECEWSVDPGHIYWDFEKLLIAKSKYKLLIFNQKTGDDIERLFENLRNSIDIFEPKVPNENYLLAGFSMADQSFRYATVSDHVTEMAAH